MKTMRIMRTKNAQITAQRLRNFKDNNAGSALITAITVGVIVMVFSLMVLLSSYSLFSSINRKTGDIRSRELANSAAEAIYDELANVDYDTFDKQQVAASANQDALWFFVRYNVWQTSWSYYNPEEAALGHGINMASKYFDLDVGDVAETVKVRLYWEKGTSTEDNKDGTILHIVATANAADSTYSAERTLELQITEYVEVTDKTLVTGNSNVSVNSGGNEIKRYEKWSWNAYD